ncbi:GNAT family protein [Streptomyces sp. 71268]|uniref:GNAT family N-acetyltransferase n=1 Tax=Streptomyces sp. 71268 TaxID=3002640 RepID=UPI0023FA0B2C|nr:GNAT family protein [Streptomyces sp. 71268]WEV26401.1 GNAT family protein [Streptomyces sp. 71268]
MLRGGEIGLRARHADDIPLLHAGLYDDVANTARAAGRPWRPIPPGSPHAQFVVDDTERGDEGNVSFSVVELAGGSLVGAAMLWGVDPHNRSAHLGLGLLPAARGKGYGTDVVAALCYYGFAVRGLHRLQIDTLADNTAMLRSAERNGFVREAVRRSASRVLGEFLDQVHLGLLAEDWQPAARG